MISNAFTTFVPQSTIAVAGTTTSARAELPIGSNGVGERPQVRLLHTGTTLAFVAFGDASVAATTSGLPLVGSQPESFSVPFGATHVAIIYGTGSGTLYATSGFGA